MQLNVGLGDIGGVTNATVSGPMEINTSFEVDGSGSISLKLGNTTLAAFNHPVPSGTHSLRVDVDASGNSSVFVDGVQDTSQNHSGIAVSTPAALGLKLAGTATTATFGPIAITSGASPASTAQVANASSLSSLSLSTVTDALAQVAGMRATNGAEQSRLNFSAQTLTTNQTNIQSAISSITDVDVAAETTRLAKWNVLVQSGTSMLSQANQSAQVALKLISG